MSVSATPRNTQDKIYTVQYSIKKKKWTSTIFSRPSWELVFKLCTWGCTIYLHNYISPTFVVLVTFLSRFYCYFFYHFLFSNPIEMKYYVIYSHRLSADPIKWLFSQLHNYNLIKHNYLLYNMWNLLQEKTWTEIFWWWTLNETKWHWRAKLISGALIEYWSTAYQALEKWERTRKQAAKQLFYLASAYESSRFFSRSSPLGTSVVKHFNRIVIQCFPASSSFYHFNYCLF